MGCAEQQQQAHDSRLTAERESAINFGSLQVLKRGKVADCDDWDEKGKKR